MSILNKEWQVRESRPFSPNELMDSRTNFFTRNRISKYYVYHQRCCHIYYVKENSRKWNDIHQRLETTGKEYGVDIGSCFVCWKLRNIKQKVKAKELIFMYNEAFDNVNSPSIRYWDLAIEKIFYTWLYREKVESRKRPYGNNNSNDYKNNNYSNGNYNNTNNSQEFTPTFSNAENTESTKIENQNETFSQTTEPFEEPRKTNVSDTNQLSDPVHTTLS